jgi:hypothetical protein
MAGMGRDVRRIMRMDLTLLFTSFIICLLPIFHILFLESFSCVEVLGGYEKASAPKRSPEVVENGYARGAYFNLLPVTRERCNLHLAVCH